MFIVFNRWPVSQAECRRFDPGLPLQQNQLDDEKLALESGPDLVHFSVCLGNRFFIAKSLTLMCAWRARWRSGGADFPYRSLVRLSLWRSSLICTFFTLFGSSVPTRAISALYEWRNVWKAVPSGIPLGNSFLNAAA